MATSTPSESNGKYVMNGGGEKHDEEEEDSINVASQWMNALVLPLALRSCVELGVFDIIAKAGEGARLSSKEIAAQIGSNNPDAPGMLDRILRLLASHSVLNCSTVNNNSNNNNGEEEEYHNLEYSLSPASKHLVSDAEGVSLGHVLPLILDKVFFQSWRELKGAIMEGGIPFNRVYGMHAFEYPGVDPRFNDVFNKAMHSSTTVTMKRILQLYTGFEGIKTLVDVGGGLGVNLKLITAKYPHLHAINFDLPHVIQHASAYPRVEHVGGDMFQSVPNGDAIFMKQILHDWSDEDCLKLLKKCYESVPDEGKVIVVESIIPVVPEKTVTAKNAFSFDLFMLTQNPGGRERTRQQFTQLAIKSGFSGVHFVCSAPPFWVMEFFK